MTIATASAPEIEPHDPCAVVIFGVFGDLTRRRLVLALFNLMVDGALPEQTAIVGLGRHDLTTDQLRAEGHDYVPAIEGP